MHWETKKCDSLYCNILFIVRSGTETTISRRYACSSLMKVSITTYFGYGEVNYIKINAKASIKKFNGMS